MYNHRAFFEGGWFLAGKFGQLDDQGYLTITNRKNDIIICGGGNISFREVEEDLNPHLAVWKSAAVADDKLGEKFCAFVVILISLTVKANGKGPTQKGRHRHVMTCDGGKGNSRKGLFE